MNWGFLEVLSLKFKSSSSGNSKPFWNARRKTNAWKCAASLIALLYCSYALKKIYEVPVYVTKIDAITSNCVIDSARGVSIGIFRNYDREDKKSLMRDSVWESYNQKARFSGGVYVDGYCNIQRGAHSANKEKTEAVLNALDSICKDKDYTPIDAPNLFYLSIETTRRQKFYPPTLEIIEHVDTLRGDIIRSHFNGDKTIVDTLYYKRVFDYLVAKTIPNGNTCLSENYVATTNKDSLMIFSAEIKALSHGMPTYYVAEDISKLVEVIYVGEKKDSLQDVGIWKYVRNLTFDYAGPAEFSEHIIPEPDEITLSSIHYRNSAKIQEIGRNGLRFHAKFPDMENRQEARIFILSAIVTGLGAMFLRYLWRLLTDAYRLVINETGEKKRFKWFVIMAITALCGWFLYKLYISISYANVEPYGMFNSLVN